MNHRLPLRVVSCNQNSWTERAGRASVGKSHFREWFLSVGLKMVLFWVEQEFQVRKSETMIVLMEI